MLDPHAMAVAGAVHQMLKPHVEACWREVLERVEERIRAPAARSPRLRNHKSGPAPFPRRRREVAT